MKKKTNCGVGQISFGGATHVLLQAVFELKDGLTAHNPTTTLCGTEAPSSDLLYNDEWGFKNVYEAMDFMNRKDIVICKRCIQSVSRLRSILKREE